MADHNIWTNLHIWDQAPDIIRANIPGEIIQMEETFSYENVMEILH